MSLHGQLYAALPFQYQDLHLDAGQLVKLEGTRNDAKLHRLGYLREVEPRTTVMQCGECGEHFVADAQLNLHGRRRHGKTPRGVTPDPSNPSIESDSDERALNAAARSAIRWDNTSAARGVKPDTPLEATTVPVKRRPGRPKGSKNKKATARKRRAPARASNA